ncbi:MAG: hypothetical protein ABI723_27240 [Bacteroidia bacterium]
MNNHSTDGMTAQLAEYETPFADNFTTREDESRNDSPVYTSQFFQQAESPFSQSFEAPAAGQTSSPAAGEFVNFLSELHDTEFPNTLYELAAELEDTWSSKISNETAMGDRFVPFATQQAMEYFAPLTYETGRMFDRVTQQFTGNNLSDHNETEIERFFTELEFEHNALSPAQEQFFGSLFNKVKSAVKAGVNLAKKGISFVGKFLPVNIILGKLRNLVQPLLNKVLKFAIGKLPQNLQPYAKTLANKFMNLPSGTPSQSQEFESDNEFEFEFEIPSSGNLEVVQTELDNQIANLVFAQDENEAEEFVMNYETSNDTLERELNYETGGLNIPSLETARQQFINELKNLKEGESPSPAIERFIPAAIMALQPIIKMGISIIGRQKVINFLAGLLSKLVGRYVPANVAQPLSASIIDTGMSAIGFETYEVNKTDVAYEVITNTIQETIQNLGSLSDETLNDEETLTGQVLEAFENAAGNNFPSQYIREELRPTTHHGSWVSAPRNGPRHFYKKFTRVFDATITPQIAEKITTFRGLPLANFLRDKLGLDPGKPIQARVHLYEAVPGTRLSQINRYERVPGLGPSQPHGGTQLHPLSKEAASLLFKEPRLGRDFSTQFTTRRHRTAVGQRFYYLEINGARLRITHTVNRTHRNQPPEANANPVVKKEFEVTDNRNPSRVRAANSSDIHGVINFVRSEIRLNYYFSEEEAIAIVEKLNKNDNLGAAKSIRTSVRNVLNEMLLRNVQNKVRIIHEAMPEMYLENYVEQEENLLPDFGKILNRISLNPGRHLLTSIVKRLTGKLSEIAYQAVSNYFRARAAEFKQAQAQPQDGVTIKIIWTNVQGMSAIRAVINAVKGNLALGNLGSLSLPHIPAPEIKISAGKNFD